MKLLLSSYWLEILKCLWPLWVNFEILLNKYHKLIVINEIFENSCKWSWIIPCLILFSYIPKNRTANEVQSISNCRCYTASFSQMEASATTHGGGRRENRWRPVPHSLQTGSKTSAYFTEINKENWSLGPGMLEWGWWNTARKICYLQEKIIL